MRICLLQQPGEAEGGKQNYPHLGLDTITLKPSGGVSGKKQEGSQEEKGDMEGNKSI